MLMVVLAALVIGAVFGFVMWRSRKGAAEAATWPSAEGRITASEVLTSRDEGQLEHRPHVAYAFEVEGHRYTGARVRFGLTRYGLAPSRKLCERYPVGSNVPVY